MTCTCIRFMNFLYTYTIGINFVYIFTGYSNPIVFIQLLKKKRFRSNQFKALLVYEYKHSCLFSPFYNCLQMHFLAVLSSIIDNIYLIWILYIYSYFIWYSWGWLWWIILLSTYSYTESQEYMDWYKTFKLL